ncbi:hypothetical protein QZH41_004266 [Actinostola sp. cb2023]|nr:hypothetical protein QZH41_004266 [Actinostola sp. cb2023]
MSNYDSDNGSDVEFDILPYQFEPVVNVNTQSTENDSSESSGSEDEGDLDSSRLGNTDWCECSECQQMPTGAESLCCHEIDAVLEKMEDHEAYGFVNCVTEIPAFSSVCMDKDVLQTAFITFLLYEGPIDDEPINEYATNLLNEIENIESQVYTDIIDGINITFTFELLPGDMKWLAFYGEILFGIEVMAPCTVSAKQGGLDRLDPEVLQALKAVTCKLELRRTQNVKTVHVPIMVLLRLFSILSRLGINKVNFSFFKTYV